MTRIKYWMSLSKLKPSNLKIALLNSWSLSWRKNNSRNSDYFLNGCDYSKENWRNQRRLVAFAGWLYGNVKWKLDRLEHLCVVREASNFRLRTFTESLRGEALKGLLSYSKKRKRTGKRLERYSLKNLYLMLHIKEISLRSLKTQSKQITKIVGTYAKELYARLGNVCWHLLFGISTNDQIYGRSIRSIQQSQDCKALESWFKGLKLLKLSESWSETKNNRLDWRKDGTQTHKQVQNATNSQQSKPRSQELHMFKW